MQFIQKIKKLIAKTILYNQIYQFKTSLPKRSCSDIFVYFGVVGDLVLYYNFIEQYCRATSKTLSIVTLKNTRPFLTYMDQENRYIDFDTSVFFDPDPTKREWNASDEENFQKLSSLSPQNTYAMPYEIDFFTFLILNLIHTKNTLAFIASGQSIIRQLLCKILFPKIQFIVLPVLASNPRIDTHSEAFFHLYKRRFSFISLTENEPSLPYAVISPFASAKDKEYPYEKFKEVSSILYNKYGIRSIYLGLSDLNEEDTDSISYEYNIPVEILFERIKRCRIFIGNDSGLTHIALRYNKKTIVLFSRLKIYGLYFPYNNAIMITNQTISDIDPEEIVQKVIND
ncbi:glycosyltransferase family 9 protein [Sulfuricurvum sp.]|uniref:glycosyltransferase family 9 protein n=1 Tax=Sulfuricurvum sp. TaxID=2025608 RepID=UPI0019A6E6FF|nr:glycosyltransferase family 9 protein [Sulfuricurvum sp.]MBD3805967.1 hypothetical protein [Sulfuricurvum sp.]